MWVMTPFGFVSVVARPPKTVELGDDRSLQIRARSKNTLMYLKRHYMPTTLGTISNTPERDYQFRAYCSKTAWADALVRMAEEIDYENFKDHTLNKDVHDLSMRVWWTIFDHYEPETPDRRRKKGKRNA